MKWHGIITTVKKLPLSFYQPAAREAHGRLVLRLLCRFRVCISVNLCVRTYHVRNNYVTYIVARRPYLCNLDGCLALAAMSSLPQLRLRGGYREAEATSTRRREADREWKRQKRAAKYSWCLHSRPLTNRVCLSGSQRRRLGWFLDMKYQTCCYSVCLFCSGCFLLMSVGMFKLEPTLIWRSLLVDWLPRWFFQWLCRVSGVCVCVCVCECVCVCVCVYVCVYVCVCVEEVQAELVPASISTLHWECMEILILYT